MWKTRTPSMLGLTVGIALVAGPALARSPKACTATAKTMFNACKAEMADDALVAKAICLNVADDAARSQCLAAVKTEKGDKKEECAGQRELRRGACKLIGEDPYDPDVSPALFDDPKNPTVANPYFPMTVGDKWEYRGEDEVNTVEILDETKSILGVACLVFEDLVFKAGELREATDDWYCQKKTGDVWYFGEETGEYESFPGDEPQNAELVSVDGSFKAGRDGDKGGLFVPNPPAAGMAYYEEFSLGNAEDVTEILSTTYAFGSDANLDQAVPQALVDRFCGAADCMVTKNYSLLEPGAFAHKFYAAGVGVILEVEFEDDAVAGTVQLVHCNFDARCENLPQP